MGTIGSGDGLDIGAWKCAARGNEVVLSGNGVVLLSTLGEGGPVCKSAGGPSDQVETVVNKELSP